MVIPEALAREVDQISHLTPNLIMPDESTNLGHSQLHYDAFESQLDHFQHPQEPLQSGYQPSTYLPLVFRAGQEYSLSQAEFHVDKMGNLVCKDGNLDQWFQQEYKR